MNAAEQFRFDDEDDVDMALLVAFYGMSGSGKTYSAISWAEGAARVQGGDVGVIDTESGRAMHYHKRKRGPFSFRHMSLEPPYTTQRYQEAIDACVDKGCSAIVVDTYSHEHNGIGGVLEQHGAELQRLTKGDAGKMQDMNGMAWMAPKRARKAQFNRLLQRRIPVAFCFRATHGTDWNFRDERGKRKPRSLGIVPVGDWDTIYEMTVAMLFRSGCDGIPDWHPNTLTEPATATLAKKCPGQFRELLNYAGNGVQITPAIGEAMARWSSGKLGTKERTQQTELLTEAIACALDLPALALVGKAISALSTEQREALRPVYAAKLNALQPAGGK